jgi:hypothetical protein
LQEENSVEDKEGVKWECSENEAGYVISLASLEEYRGEREPGTIPASLTA